METCRLNSAHVRIGVPLPGNVYDSAGQLLLSKGHVPENQAQIDAFRVQILRAWRRYEQEYRFVQDEGIRSGLIIGWDDEVRKLDEKATQINKQVESYNLKRPLENLEIYKLRLDEELGRAGARRYLRDMSGL